MRKIWVISIYFRMLSMVLVFEVREQMRLFIVNGVKKEDSD